MTTYTSAEVNTWFQTIDGLPTTTPVIPTNISSGYVASLNAGTATEAQINANLENFPFNPAPPPTNVSTDLFYRTSVADFVLTEFQLAWGVVPTSGASSQYDAWVARVIADPTSVWTGGGMSMALIGTPEFAALFGTNNPDQPASIGQINQLCANCGITPGAGALLNVGLPIWQVLQNFAESSVVAAALDAKMANFQNLLVATPPQIPSGSILTLPNSSGDIFPLTPAADTFSTAASGAVFNAFPFFSSSGLVNNTLNAGDNLTDTAGDGTLNYTASSSSFSNPNYAVGVTMSGIKTLNYTGSFSFGGDNGGFQGAVTGLTVVNDTGSTGGLQLGGVGQGLVTPLTNVNISGYAPIGGIFDDTPAMFMGIISAGAGTSTTPLAVTISGPVGSSVARGAAVLSVATDGSPGTAASPNAAYSAWDLTLNSTAFLQLEQSNTAPTFAPAPSVGGVTTLTLSGAGNAFLGQDVAGDWQKLTTIDASAETGTVVITGASAGVFHNAFGSAADPTWLLGSAAGFLNEGITGTFALTTFDLGTGTNVLDVSSASPTELAALTTTPAATVATDNVIIVDDAVATTTSTATFAHIAGFESLGVTAAGGPGALGTIDMANLPTSITDIIYFTPAAGGLTITSATNGLTVDFHGNNQFFDALTVNGPTTGTATLNLDFGNAVLALEDATGFVTTTGYSTVNITAVGDVLAPTIPDSAGGISLASNGGASLTVNIAGTQAFDTGFVSDLAPTPPGPTNATDVINVTDTSLVALGITNFGIVSAAASAGLTVTDSWHNSTITGSATGPNTLAGGDGGGLAGTGNTINGGADTDSIITGIGANTINLAATHVADTVTIGSAFFGAITGPGDLANEGGWGQAFGATPTFISGPTVPPPTSLFLSAPNAAPASSSETVINNFNATTPAFTGDTLNIQFALWNNTNSFNAFGETDFGLQTIGLAAGNVGAGLIAPEMVTSGVIATNPLGDLIELTGPNSTFSGAAALATALQTGTFNLRTGILGPAVTNADAHLLVAYSDGKNIHIADVDLYNQLKGTTESLHDNVYASDMVEVVGVNSFTNLNNHLGSFVAQV
jgi:hypothetical protein